MPLDKIEIKGLKQLRRELKKLEDQGLINKVKDLNVKVADLVVKTAQSKASGVGRQQAAAAKDLSARRRANSAAIALGGRGRTKEWAIGAEFGSHRYGQFPPFRGNQWSDPPTVGYFLHPAIRDKSDEIVEMFGDGIEDITRAAFPQ